VKNLESVIWKICGVIRYGTSNLLLATFDDSSSGHVQVNDAPAQKESAPALSTCLCSTGTTFGDDIRRKPFSERKAMLKSLLGRTRNGIQYVEHTEGDGAEMFKAVCKLGLEEMVSKKLNAPYRSGPSKTWIKVKNPKAPAATRVIDETF
jgi:ATP dependent DNA ligase domain